MRPRQLFLLCFFTVTILTTQSHVIHKRGLLSKLFGSGSSRSNKNYDADMSPSERSRVRELLKNPIVITMLSAAVGMVVQKALAAKNMNDVCDNKYVKMAYMATSFNPQLMQALNLLGCNAPNRNYGGKTTNRYGVSTTPTYGNTDGDNNDNEEEGTDNQNEDADDSSESLQSGFPPEKESKLKQLLSIARGEKGAKRNFLRNLFGLSKKDKTFKKGQKLPSSSYKLDKDDADSMRNLEQEIDRYHSTHH